jgi:Flp pilus assembly protein TadD
VLRLAGFFALVLVGLALLRQVPYVGGLFSGLFGFWLGVILLSSLLTWASGVLLRRRRLAVRTRELGNVESPHNQGKLGALLLAHGRGAGAVEPLRRAVAGEPETVEWHYRLGCALLAAGAAAQAIEPLQHAVELEEEYAYGAVQLRLAEALTRAGQPEAALAALERVERNHGPSPESAYRTGVAARRLGRKDEARAAFVRVSELAAQGASYQRGTNRGWVLRAFVARLGFSG